MEYIEKRLAEIVADPPKAPTVTFDQLLAPTEPPEPLIPGRLPKAQHAR